MAISSSRVGRIWRKWNIQPLRLDTSKFTHGTGAGNEIARRRRTLLDAQVRSHGVGNDERIVRMHQSGDGPVEVARHARARPGSPMIEDTHFPDHAPTITGDYAVNARSAAEAEFLAIGGLSTDG